MSLNVDFIFYSNGYDSLFTQDNYKMVVRAGNFVFTPFELELIEVPKEAEIIIYSDEEALCKIFDTQTSSMFDFNKLPMFHERSDDPEGEVELEDTSSIFFDLPSNYIRTYLPVLVERGSDSDKALSYTSSIVNPGAKGIVEVVPTSNGSGASSDGVLDVSFLSANSKNSSSANGVGNGATEALSGRQHIERPELFVSEDFFVGGMNDGRLLVCAVECDEYEEKSELVAIETFNDKRDYFNINMQFYAKRSNEFILDETMFDTSNYTIYSIVDDVSVEAGIKSSKIISIVNCSTDILKLIASIKALNKKADIHLLYSDIDYAIAHYEVIAGSIETCLQAGTNISLSFIILDSLIENEKDAMKFRVILSELYSQFALYSVSKVWERSADEQKESKVGVFQQSINVNFLPGLTDIESHASFVESLLTFVDNLYFTSYFGDTTSIFNRVNYDNVELLGSINYFTKIKKDCNRLFNPTEGERHHVHIGVYFNTINERLNIMRQRFSDKKVPVANKYPILRKK